VNVVYSDANRKDIFLKNSNLLLVLQVEQQKRSCSADGRTDLHAF